MGFYLYLIFVILVSVKIDQSNRSAAKHSHMTTQISVTYNVDPHCQTRIQC